MDRFALLVDAGYLYAAGGELCCGSNKRAKVMLDGAACRESLVLLAQAACEIPELRTYWYDGAGDGIPSTAQQLIAALPNVKLRLGRINARGQQKGVDALIYRDLMTLAHQRAICDAFLLSGDEDLREGVKAAQDMGVRVTLVGIETRDGSYNQSRELVHEADEVIVLKRADVNQFLSCTQVDRTAVVGTERPVAVVQDAASMYVDGWFAAATSEEVTSLSAAEPQIPPTLDAELLLAAEAAVGGSLRVHSHLRQLARSAFWHRVSENRKLSAKPSPSSVSEADTC